MFKYRFTAQSVDAMCSKSKQTMNQTSLSPMSQINSCLCSRQREKEVRAAPETEVMDSTLLNESVCPHRGVEVRSRTPTPLTLALVARQTLLKKL